MPRSYTLLLPGGASADNQGVSQLGVVISQALFKPGPAGPGDLVEDRHQPPGQLFADVGGQAVALQPAQIFVNANQAECPGARRSEVRHGRQRLREELFGHGLRTPMRRAPHRGAQRPNRPAMAIFGSLLVEPAAVDAQEIVEARRFWIEGIVQERGVGCGQRPDTLGSFFQLAQQHRQNERAGVVVRAVAFRKIRRGEARVLENARRIGHTVKMIQIQLRRFMRPMAEPVSAATDSRGAAAPCRRASSKERM